MTVLAACAAAYLAALTLGHSFAWWDVRRHHLESGGFILAAVLIAASFRRAPSVTHEDAPVPASPPFMRLWLALTAASLAIYAPAIASGLFADDFVLLDAAREGRWTVWTHTFRPVLFLAWRTAGAVPLDTAATLHVLNVLLHALNATLVAAVGWRLGLPRSGSIAAAGLFTCFPASVEAVAWPAGIQDVLMTSAVLSYVVLSTDPVVRAWRIAAAMLALAVALLTKETAVAAAPLAILLCGALAAPRRSWMVAAAGCGAVLIFGAVRALALPLPDNFAGGLSRYRIKEMLVQPFATLVVPLRESESAAMPWLAAGLGCMLIALLCLGTHAWRRGTPEQRRGLALALWIPVAVLPVGVMFHVNGDLLGSRYLYLSAVAWALLIAATAAEIRPRSPMIGMAIVVLLLAGWAPLTIAHARTWGTAGLTRDRILSLAATLRDPSCAQVDVSGLPESFEGVPLFVNGFPEAMRERAPGVTYRVAAPPVAGACALTWTGSTFVRP